MLNKTRAMEVVDRVGSLISLTLQGGGPGRLTQKETDRLADAIVSIEYYMETLSRTIRLAGGFTAFDDLKSNKQGGESFILACSCAWRD